MKARAKKRRAAVPPAPKVQELLPPEGVPLHFGIATIGARFGAQLADIAITVLGLVALMVFLTMTGIVPVTGLVAVGSILFFMIRVPYYAIAEMVWNGQTLGKRLCSIRVVSGTGRSLTPHQIVARNLMREMEIFAPGTILLTAPESAFEGTVTLLWIVGVLLVPILNKRNQRLGDIIANTCVVRNPDALLYPDLAAEMPPARSGGYEFFPAQLDHYGAYELQVLANLLQEKTGASDGAAIQANREAVGARIRAKIDYPFPVAPADEKAFLKAFYRAQRAYLEQKKLFGDARADKFHREEDDGGG